MAKNKSYIGIKNEVETSTLELHFTDFIYDGFDWNTWEVTNLVQDTIDKIKAANPSTIKIIINSLGGDVMIGLALYNYLKSYKAEIEVEIIGFAASIASIIAMCASKGKLKMAKSSFMIIHAAWSYAMGNATDLRKQAEDLDKVSNELASIYAERSGKTAKHYTDLWAGGDYWFTGSEALADGIVDEIVNTEAVLASASVINSFGFKNTPAAIMNAAPSAQPTPNDQVTFFDKLNNSFMKLVDTLKAALGGAKEDPAIKNVTGGAEMLAAFERHLTPFAEAVDQANEEKPAETVVVEETKPVEEAKPAEAKPAETVPATTTTTETKPVVETVESEELKTANARILKMENDMKEMKAAMAGKNSLPENGKDPKTNTSASKAKVEFEN